MSETAVVEVVLAIATAFFGILGYLLQQKDAKQEEAIKLLWDKHDVDAKELELLKLQIASQHYVKSELDIKFDRMDNTMKEGFKSIGEEIKELSSTLLNHFKNKDS